MFLLMFLLSDFPPPPPLPLAAIVRILPQSENVPYSDLVCTEQHRLWIAELITFVAENNPAALLVREDHARHLGVQINPVYPLKFLSTVMTRVKPQFKMIFEDGWKKGPFMAGPDGLYQNLEREAKKGTLQQYVTPFAQEVGVSPSDIAPYFKDHNWEGLISFLLYR